VTYTSTSVALGSSGNQEDIHVAKTVIVVGDGRTAQGLDEDVVIAGDGGTATTGTYGLAACGAHGRANGGSGAMVFGANGSAVVGTTGAVAWSRLYGTARVNDDGVAIAPAGDATAGPRGIAFVLDRYGKAQPNPARRATAGEGGVAIVMPSTDATSPSDITAVTGKGGVALAREGYPVQGGPGALLIVVRIQAANPPQNPPQYTYQYFSAVVDEVKILSTRAYTIDANGNFI
jgi:hypothetical protein